MPLGRGATHLFGNPRRRSSDPIGECEDPSVSEVGGSSQRIVSAVHNHSVVLGVVHRTLTGTSGRCGTNVLTIYAGDSGSTGLSDVWTLSHANGTGGTPAWTHIVPTLVPS